MDDEPFAGNHLPGRRRIQIAARPRSVRRRAADHLIVEKEKVLDRYGYRIEHGLALPCSEPNFEDAFLARQRYWLSELRSNCGICCFLGSLRPGSRAGEFKRHQDRDGTDCQEAKQATCVERVVERSEERRVGK